MASRMYFNSSSLSLCSRRKDNSAFIALLLYFVLEDLKDSDEDNDKNDDEDEDNDDDNDESNNNSKDIEELIMDYDVEEIVAKYCE
ncbi:hypothetical protein RclHR1_08750013 [Rhizophagus clarus]|uniref:Uncharacterized protein n=1 Tax=Rhizophagus clarus TaxID=94130 RepID=A0A2Z6S273_9GLOM|nr:hypothetical protein RclHR1_08750013 [Rhizophagus clarus]GES95945.1 hypothetical protein RCL_jg300.t1 [Rhizophagus clarus]